MKEIINVIKKSRIPWIWVLLTFLLNIFYNQILYMIPSSTGRLMSGDLSNDVLWEVVLSFTAYGAVAVVQSAIVAFAYAVTTRRARFQLWGKMLKINEAYFDKVDSSEMFSAITFDLGSAMPDLVNLMVAVLPDIYFVVLALTKISTYDFTLLLIMLIFIPFKVIYSIVFGRHYYKTENIILTRKGILTSQISERIDNLPMVKSFNKEEHELETGSKSINELYKANVSLARLGGISLALEHGIEVLQQFIILVVAAMLLQQGKITMSEWVAFFLFTRNISMKISTIMSDWISLKSIGGTLVRTKDLYHADEEDTVPSGKDPESLTNYDIVFENVDFSYGEEPALKGVSFSVREGQKVAIVGNCGSGKSTTLALIERFYSPASGNVTLGGTPISEMKLDKYRDIIAYVPQLNQTFSDSVREVLTYGNKKSVSDDELIKASAKTGFSDYLKLHDEGLDTVVQNGGENMSGGQLQRMVITREILRDSRIILFDEPTSALDAKSSNTVKDLIMNQTGDKTVIVVTHDLSITDKMDNIIVLDNGNLIASGKYSELFASSEKFRQLVLSQNQTAEAVL